MRSRRSPAPHFRIERRWRLGKCPPRPNTCSGNRAYKGPRPSRRLLTAPAFGVRSPSYPTTPGRPEVSSMLTAARLSGSGPRCMPWGSWRRRGASSATGSSTSATRRRSTWSRSSSRRSRGEARDGEKSNGRSLPRDREGRAERAPAKPTRRGTAGRTLRRFSCSPVTEQWKELPHADRGHQ
jgi:hypothetical protein